MKSTCISHPAEEALVIIRQWQIDFCQGDTVAAALMSFFEYWHNIKLASSEQNKKSNNISELHGEERSQNETLYQFHTIGELSAGIMNIGKDDKIRLARNFLKDQGIISEHRNPNPKYSFDNTIYYLFHPEVAMAWLTSEDRKIGGREPENRSRQQENRGTITETSSENKEKEIYKEKETAADAAEENENSKNLHTAFKEEKNHETQVATSDKKKPSPNPSAAGPLPPPISEVFQQLAEAFIESKLVSRPPILTNMRRSKLQNRLKHWSLDDLIKSLKGYLTQKFYRGDNPTKWKMGIDWFINKDETIERGLEMDVQQSNKESSQSQDMIPYATQEWLAKALKI